MPLPEHVYRMLEKIVGPEYVTNREYILAAYRQPLPNMPQKPISPEAIVLPGSTREVQNLVRLCNEYKIKFIPIVSGAWFGAYPSQPETILIDLKRMNKILEINEDDKYVVIEPGVRHGQLKTELMKRGLNYPTASVGPAGSVLANFVFSGDNMVQHGISRANRYVLGAEWVTPTGEIIKLGSLGVGAGWFCPDGPGPSLRGLIKGYVGAGGGLGIITKLAIGLDAWKGPKTIPSKGRSPCFKIGLPHDCHRLFIFKFPSLDNLQDAMIEIGKAEIGYAVLKFFNATAALLLSESANDFWDLWNSGLFQRELANALFVYLATWTPEELAYEERVLMDIIKETCGEAVEESVRLKFEENMDLFILVSFVHRVLRLGGGWMPVKLDADSLTHMFEVAKTLPEFMEDFIKRGLILNAPNNFQIIPMEYGHMAHIELLILWDKNMPEWQKFVEAFTEKSLETEIKYGHRASAPPTGTSAMLKLGPLYSNYHVWTTKIKNAFDPNMVSNPSL